MNIKESILENLKSAQKAKESEKVQVLRSIISSLNNSKIEKGEELNEEESIEVLRKEVKQRKDALEQYQKGNRKDLAEIEKAEIEIIESYLPKMMAEEEVEAEIKKAIKSTGASNISDLGKIMGQVMSKLKGKADGSQVKEIATKLLK